MATLALSAAGSAVGGAVLPGFGALLGRAAGALAGAAIDQALLGAGGAKAQRDGPRLAALQVLSSSEGAPMPRLYGRARLAGQVIWATNFEEMTRDSGGSGKGTGTAMAGGRSFAYFASFAVGLCEGPITRIGRIWADGQELDQSSLPFRVHLGSEDQLPDSLIEAKQGAGLAPAYRGLAYVVFERLALAPFGNRIPQLNFEIFRAVDDFEASIRAVTLIPGAGEFAYQPAEVRVDGGAGTSYAENRHTAQGPSDFAVAIDQLQSSLPNARAVSLYAAWFGDSLDAGRCSVRPKVETRDKGRDTEPFSWGVAGLSRESAQEVSKVDGRPAYGGAPDDASLIAALRDLTARGLDVVLTPFLLMDCAGYPWRGRISGSDGTAAARAEVAAFVGSNAPGAGEWSYRRFILHMAGLAAQAGGVKGFVIGSEMRGLTTLRDESGAYPFVAALVRLAADVKALLPGAAITYAADWSEWRGHDLGGGDFAFHLDPLWASPAIDAIGIDFYPPLADTRQGETPVLDIAGGEGFDWYYSSDADRRARLRTPITDGAYGKPWVYRVKDLAGWWDNAHFNRRGGVEDAQPSAWQPRMKPIWLTEIGCPAVDKGANQPNVFVDPKSSESALPHFSHGIRDDLEQRRAIRAVIDTYATGGMVDPARVFVYTWDARPSPVFPAAREIWADSDNWALGHWLSGRTGDAPLGALIERLAADHGVTVSAKLPGAVAGLIVDRIIPARDVIQPLEDAFGFDAVESGGRIVFRPRAQSNAVELAENELLEADAPLAISRTEDAQLPRAAKLNFIDASGNYAAAIAEAQRSGVATRRVAQAALPVVMRTEDAQRRAGIWLQEAWSARETAAFGLPPSRLAIELGDTLRITARGRSETLRVTALTIGQAITAEAVSCDASVYEAPGSGRERGRLPSLPPVTGPADFVFLDLPDFRDDGAEHGYVAAFAWPFSGIALYRAAGASGFVAIGEIDAPATLGRLDAALEAGPAGRWDNAAAIEVALAGGELAGADDAAILAGANLAAIESHAGWELVQFTRAELAGERKYRLSRLLRGRFGTEGAMVHPVGSRFVLLDAAVAVLPMPLDEIGRAFNWRIAPAGVPLDHSAVRSTSHAFAGTGFRPLAPVHLRGIAETGAWRISWVRRARRGADNWALAEIPLDEAREAWRVEALDAAGAVIAVQETDRPEALIAGGAARVRIRQIGIIRGEPSEIALP